jgi:hypothetical protein
MFQIIGAMAEFERSLIQERVRAGLRNAKLRERRWEDHHFRWTPKESCGSARLGPQCMRFQHKWMYPRRLFIKALQQRLQNP